MKRTIAIKLKVPEAELKALFDLQTIFSQACNFVAQVASNEKEFNRIKLHHLSYYRLRQIIRNLALKCAAMPLQKFRKRLRHRKEKEK